MRRFEFIMEFQAADEVEAAFFIEVKFNPLVKEFQETRDAFGFVREVTDVSQRRSLDTRDSQS